MSIIWAGAFDRRGGAATAPQSFWRRCATALDSYLAGRSRVAVPATALRRSHHDLARCRRLLHATRATAPTAAARNSS